MIPEQNILPVGNKHVIVITGRIILIGNISIIKVEAPSPAQVAEPPSPAQVAEHAQKFVP